MLPAEAEHITEVNLTLSINTTKELVIASRALREYYFFYKISESWIQIFKTDNHNPDTPLNNLQDLIQTVQQK